MRRINQYVRSVFLIGEDGGIDAHLGTYACGLHDDAGEMVRHAVARPSNQKHEMDGRLVGVVSATGAALLLQGRLTDRGLRVDVYTPGGRATYADIYLTPEALVGEQERERKRQERNRKTLERLKAEGVA